MASEFSVEWICLLSVNISRPEDSINAWRALLGTVPRRYTDVEISGTGKGQARVKGDDSNPMAAGCREAITSRDNAIENVVAK